MSSPCAQVQFTNWDVRPHWRVHLMFKWVPQCLLFTFSLKVLLSPSPWSCDPSPINLLDWIQIIQLETLYLYVNMDGSFLCPLLSSQAHWISLVQIITLLFYSILHRLVEECRENVVVNKIHSWWSGVVVFQLSNFKGFQFTLRIVILKIDNSIFRNIQFCEVQGWIPGFGLNFSAHSSKFSYLNL